MKYLFRHVANEKRWKNITILEATWKEKDFKLEMNSIKFLMKITQEDYPHQKESKKQF